MKSFSYSNWLRTAGVLGVSAFIFNGIAITQNQTGTKTFIETNNRKVYPNFKIYLLPTGASTVPMPATLTAPPPTTKAVGPFDDLIQTISNQHGVDPRLTRAVIEVESSFKRQAVSHMGAQGLMQLIPDTASRFGVNDPFDPAQNIAGGVRYLRFLLEKFNGNFDLSVASYNSGENRVARIGRIPDIPETQNYVRKVRASYTRMGGSPDHVFPVATVQKATPAITAPAAAPIIVKSLVNNSPTAPTFPDISRGKSPSPQSAPIAQGISSSIKYRGSKDLMNFRSDR